MKSANKILLLTLLGLSLSACVALTPDEVHQSKKTEAITLIQLQSSINGIPTTGIRRYCMPTIVSVETGKQVKRNFFDDQTLAVVKSDPGLLKLESVTCSENKVFYNRIRTHTLKKPIVFQADAGYVNYIGKIYMNYIPSTFSVGDIFFTGVGSSTDEEFRLTMKVEDDYAEGQKKFLEHYGQQMPKGFAFKKNLIKLGH